MSALRQIFTGKVRGSLEGGSLSVQLTVRWLNGQDLHVPIGEINPVVKGEVFTDKGFQLASIRVRKLEFTDKVGRLFQAQKHRMYGTLDSRR